MKKEDPENKVLPKGFKDSPEGQGSRENKVSPEKTDKEKMIEIKDSEYQKLMAQAAEYKDKFLRLYAEFENTRKRYERDKSEFIKYANEGLVTEFLGVVDDLHRTVEAARAQHQDYSAFLKGIEIVMTRIDDLLKKNGVKPMESVGKKFDPNCHEVLMQVETDEHENEQVIEEFQKGYYLGDRVVRTAKVKVAINNGQKDNEKEGAPAGDGVAAKQEDPEPDSPE